MQLTIKTLKNEVFTVDAEPTTTVEELRALVAANRSWGLKSLKLIFSGDILKDDKKTIGGIGITGKDGEFIVTMGKAGPKVTAPAVTPAADEKKTEEPKPTPPPPTVEDKPTEELKKDTDVAMDTSSNAPPSYGTEEQITNIMGMGFTRAQAEQALRAAFGNVDRAADYLMSGNMPSSDDMETDGVPTEPLPTTATSTSTPTPTTTAQTPLNAGPPQPLSHDSPLHFLLENPQFMTIRNFVQNQPHMLPALLQEINREQPDLIGLINENREDFYNLLNTPVDGGAMSPGQGVPGAGGQRRGQQIQVTPEENAAIDRMVAMGFAKGDVVQAYFACDKNEDLAVNMLLSDQD